MNSGIIYEICCDSLQSALNAQQAGAHRVELCSALELGGITPSYGLIQQVRKRVKLELNVLIRPRGGDFLYESEEVAVMISDIQACAGLGVNGVVIGALDPYGNVDMDTCRALVAVARHLGLSVTFHRAIDRARNIYEALEDIIDLGVDRVLTSGGAPTALAGLDTIAKMNQIAAARSAGAGHSERAVKTIIMPGAGINASNIREIIARTGVREIHFSASVTYDSPMLWRGDASESPLFPPNSFIRHESSLSKIQETIVAATN